MTMILKEWTVEELKAWDEENQISTGEPVEAGWYFQHSDQEAPIGPYKTKKEAEEAFEKQNSVFPKEAAKLTITVQNHEGYWIWSVETSDEQWDHCGGGETFYECMDDLKNNLEEIKKRIDISDD